MSRYADSIVRYRDTLKQALEVADDPYKAPEQVVATGKAVVFATWDMQIEYAAMMRESKERT
jgi:hypothetical protein